MWKCLISLEITLDEMGSTVGHSHRTAMQSKCTISPLSLPFILEPSPLLSKTPPEGKKAHYSLSLSQRQSLSLSHSILSLVLSNSQDGQRWQADQAQVSSKEMELIQQAKASQRESHCLC